MVDLEHLVAIMERLEDKTQAKQEKMEAIQEGMEVSRVEMKAF
jgi:hypothetical protein